MHLELDSGRLLLLSIIFILAFATSLTTSSSWRRYTTLAVCSATSFLGSSLASVTSTISNIAYW